MLTTLHLLHYHPHRTPILAHIASTPPHIWFYLVPPTPAPRRRRGWFHAQVTVCVCMCVCVCCCVQVQQLHGVWGILTLVNLAFFSESIGQLLWAAESILTDSMSLCAGFYLMQADVDKQIKYIGAKK